VPKKASVRVVKIKALSAGEVGKGIEMVTAHARDCPIPDSSIPADPGAKSMQIG
jgi:hypothetical protein